MWERCGALPDLATVSILQRVSSFFPFRGVVAWVSVAGVAVEFGAMMNFRAGRVVVTVAAVLAAGLCTAALAVTPEEDAVLAPVKAMFDGMSKRDAAAVKAATLPGGSMVLMRNGKPTQMTFDAFADIVARPGTTKIEERIHDPLRACG